MSAIVQKAGNTFTGTTGSVTVNSTGSGNLILVSVKDESGSATSVAVSDGTTSFTVTDTHNFGGASGFNLTWAYLLSSNSGKTSIDVTMGASRECQVSVWEISPTGGSTWALDVGGTGSFAQGNSATPTSGDVTTTGTDEAVFGAYADFSGSTPSTFQINGVAADDSKIQTFSASWVRLLGATFTNGHANCTISANEWIAGIIAFKATAGGGGPTAAQLSGVFDQLHLGSVIIGRVDA